VGKFFEIGYLLFWHHFLSKIALIQTFS